MNKIPNQIPVWEKKHGAGDHEELRGVPSPLAELAEIYFPRRSKILELGCGVGRDAAYFAAKGHTVLATDGAANVIEKDKQRLGRLGVQFDVVDMLKSLPFEDESFGVVFANLSLHYYSTEDTSSIVQEIERVLEPGGVVAVAVKSYDELHSQGQEISPNVFVGEDGRAIHLLSKEDIKSLTVNFYELYLDEVEEEYNGRYSKIVRYIGEKTNK